MFEEHGAINQRLIADLTVAIVACGVIWSIYIAWYWPVLIQPAPD